MLYRIRNPRITKLALVKTPASGHRFHLLKTALPWTVATAGQIIKPSASDWRIAYTVVAEPGHVEGGGITKTGAAATDEHGQPVQDVWDEDAIREAAHSFARNGGLTSDQHFGDGQTLGRWAESYIAPVDHSIEGKSVKAGSWILGIEPTAEGRAAIESGEIGGVSVEGDATREPVLKANGGNDVPDDDCGCTDRLIEDAVMAAVAKQVIAKATLKAAQRKKLPKSAFALPGGRYPIHDRSHAQNALSRVAQHGSPAEQATVRRKVCRRYPDLPSCKSK